MALQHCIRIVYYTVQERYPVCFCSCQQHSAVNWQSQWSALRLNLERHCYKTSQLEGRQKDYGHLLLKVT